MKNILLIITILGATLSGFGQVEYTSSGSGSSYALTYPANISTVTNGLSFTFKANHSSTGAATLNVNTLGAIAIKKEVTLDLVTNDILIGQIVTVVYDGTNFQMTSKAGTSAGAGADTHIQDTGGDTFIETDALGTGAGDVIDFDLGGTAQFQMDGPHLNVLNSGRSVFLGEGAGLNDDLSNNFNTFIGYNSGNANVGGAANSALGMNSLSSNVGGIENTSIGNLTLVQNIGGSQNVAVGISALTNNTNGDENVALGGYSLFNSSTADGNTAVGFAALNKNTIGFDNIGVGNNAVRENTTGDDNVGVGVDAINNNTIGNSNVGIGNGALFSNVSGSRATAVGTGAMYYVDNTASPANIFNVAFGYEALRGTTTASINTGTRNSAIGYQALFINSTGSRNTALGHSVLFNNSTGDDNVAIGYNTMFDNTIGNENIALGSNVLVLNTTGSANIALGVDVLRTNLTGSNNVAVGDNALRVNLSSENTAVGRDAGLLNTTGSNNTFIGSRSNAAASGLTNATALGYNSIVTASNTVQLGLSANVDFDGALMPNSLAGNSGEVLTSQGAGVAPIWQAATGGSGWDLLGNAGTGATDFVGTTDAQALKFKTNNVQAMYIGQTNQNVGIGTESPLGRFHVAHEGSMGNAVLENASSSGPDEAFNLNFVRARNNLATKQSVLTGDRLGVIGFNGYNFGNGSYEESAQIMVEAAEDYTNSFGSGANMVFRVTPLGGNSAQDAMTIRNTGSVGIGTNNPAASLDVTGTDAIVLPQGTTAQRPAAPEQGMLRYNADLTTFEGYDGTIWTDLAAGWGLTGNSGTVDGTNFIGTTDNVPLNFIANNQKAGRIETASATGNTFYGSTAGNVNTGIYNTFIGYRAGAVNTSGDRNNFIGMTSGDDNTTGSHNNSLGTAALFTNSTGWGNTAIGHNSQYNTTGNNNTGIGKLTLFENISGSNNVALGINAGPTSSNPGLSDRLYIDNVATDNPLIGGDFSSNQVYINGALGVGTSTPTTDLHLVGSHMRHSGAQPSGTGNGTVPGSTDMRGAVNVNFSPTNSITVTFTQTFTVAPTVIITPVCNADPSANARYWVNNVSTTGFTVNWSNTNSTPAINYMVIE